MGKHGIVCNKGINDMPRGWIRANEWNRRVYQVWKRMLQRCYSEKIQEKHQTYENCYVCERWLTLSNFVKDVVKIDNYEYWRDNPNQRVALDKDIKSNGTNKCYCLENCCFTTIEENARQSAKTRDNTKISEAKKGKNKGKNNYMYGKHHTEETRAKISEANKGKNKGKNHPMYGKHHSEEARKKMSEARNGQLIAQIDKNTNRILNLKYQFEYVKDDNFNRGNISDCCRGRQKTHKNYIWKYISDCSDEQINEYIIRTKQISITN